MTKTKYIRITPKVHQQLKIKAAKNGEKIQETAERAILKFLKEK